MLASYRPSWWPTGGWSICADAGMEGIVLRRCTGARLQGRPRASGVGAERESTLCWRRIGRAGGQPAAGERHQRGTPTAALAHPTDRDRAGGSRRGRRTWSDRGGRPRRGGPAARRDGSAAGERHQRGTPTAALAHPTDRDRAGGSRRGRRTFCRRRRRHRRGHRPPPVPPLPPAPPVPPLPAEQAATAAGHRRRHRCRPAAARRVLPPAPPAPPGAPAATGTAVATGTAGAAVAGRAVARMLFDPPGTFVRRPRAASTRPGWPRPPPGGTGTLASPTFSGLLQDGLRSPSSCPDAV